MKISHSLLGLSALLVLVAVLPSADAKVGEEAGVAKKRVPKQIYDKPSVVDSEEDHKTAETGFGAAGVGGHGKYFQDNERCPKLIFMYKWIRTIYICHLRRKRQKRRVIRRFFVRPMLAMRETRGHYKTLFKHPQFKLDQQYYSYRPYPPPRNFQPRYQHNPEHDHYEFGYRRGNDHHFQERYEKAHPHEGKFKTKVRWGDKKGGYGEHYYDYNHAGHGHGDDGGDGGGSNDGGEGGYSEPVPDYKPVNEYKHKSKRYTNKQAAATPVDAAPAASQVAQKRAATPDFTQLVFDVESGLVIDEVTGQTYSLRAVN